MILAAYSGPDWYVAASSPTGTILANGSPDYPFSLYTALSNPDNRILSNQTIYLRAGTYSGDFTNSLVGSPGSNITVQAYPGERVIINGYFQVNGSYTTFKDIEFCYLDWVTRESSESGTAAPTDLPDKTVNIRAPGVKFINCIFHDLMSPYVGLESPGAEIYGLVSYFNGWTAPDRGHGHGLYVQNNTTGTFMNFKDIITFDNFGWGIQAYSSTGAKVESMNFVGITSFMSGGLDTVPHREFVIGADAGVSHNINFNENMGYRTGTTVGLEYYGAGVAFNQLNNNFIVQNFTGPHTAVQETGNFWATGTVTWDTYFLRGNQYNSNRANLTIYNQLASNNVTVDVSSLGWTGQVLARNVQDYFVDIQTLTISGGTITVNMQASNRTVATPVAWTPPAKTFPEFGCFVLEKI